MTENYVAKYIHELWTAKISEDPSGNYYRQIIDKPIVNKGLQPIF